MKVSEVKISSIVIGEDRQRKDLGDIAEFAEAIKARSPSGRIQDGLINPIILRGNVLVAGERRLRAHMLDGAETIFARQWKDLDEVEAEVIELEENVRRKDLTWWERAEAIQRVHKLMRSKNPEWGAVQTAEHLGYKTTTTKGSKGSGATISQALALEGHITESLKKAPSLETAFNTVSRQQHRQLDDISNKLLGSASIVPNIKLPNTPPPAQLDDVQQISFLDWAPSYSGAKFNFIHCDFPYGINLQSSDQMSHDTEKLYEDSPELYWELCHSFVKHLDNFCYPSAHVMFWLSADLDILSETFAFFKSKEAETGLRWFSRPLVWHKSCGSGVIPDARRRPRNTYEVALMASRQDRFVVKPVNGSYAAPITSGKARMHPSEKPEPMLKHFFQLFVDENSQVLDPTCGGGSALRAAEELGAKRVLGLEIDPEFAGTAKSQLRISRSKREAALKLGDS